MTKVVPHENAIKDGHVESASEKVLHDLEKTAARMLRLAQNPRQLCSAVAKLEAKPFLESEGVWTVAISPDRNTMVYGTDKNRLVFVNLSDFSVAHEMEIPHPFALCYSPDGRMLTLTQIETSLYTQNVNKEKTLYLIDTTTHEIKFWGVEGWYTSGAVFHPHQQTTLATIGLPSSKGNTTSESVYQLLRVDSETFSVKTMSPLPSLTNTPHVHVTMTKFRFTACGKKLLFGIPCTRRLSIIDWESGELIGAVPTGGMIWDITLHPSRLGLVALACGDKKARVVDLSAVTTHLTLECHQEVSCTAFSPAGNTLAVGVVDNGDGQIVKCYDTG
jgi:WD40 repeat protein